MEGDGIWVAENGKWLVFEATNREAVGTIKRTARIQIGSVEEQRTSALTTWSRRPVEAVRPLTAHSRC